MFFFLASDRRLDQIDASFLVMFGGSAILVDGAGVLDITVIAVGAASRELVVQIGLAVVCGRGIAARWAVNFAFVGGLWE